MKNYKYIFIVIAFILFLGVVAFCFFNNKNEISQNNNTVYERTSAENNTVEYENTNSVQPENTDSINSENITNPTPIEEDLSSFSTKIYSKDANRQTNLQITASTLNDTIIEPGNTFSFTNTVGKSSPDKGYKEADIYDGNGKKIKGYGGGNCQISSTLYNAVLQLPNLAVKERHPHSKKVPYVSEGKDAAVAYGSIDFKFINNYDFPIKIYCSVDSKNVSIRIVKIS